MSAKRSELVRYDAMCRAIAEAYEVDEVKEIRDKAKAIEVYARQSKNTEAETQACRIRLRAERRMGELLASMEKAKGSLKRGADKPPPRSSSATTGAKTLSDLGLTKNESARAQQLASVPRVTFEEALAREKPTAAAIIAEAKPKQKVEPMREGVLWLWGRLKDFERNGILDEDARALLGEMTEPMRQDVLRIAPTVAQWLGRISDGE